MKDNEFQCVMCKGVFTKGWSEEEALAEAERTFGKPVSEWKQGAQVVCDDCYNKIHPFKSENVGKLLEARKEI